MKKIFVFLITFFMIVGFASALEVNNSTDAFDDVYGFVRPGDEITWNRFWYYITSDGNDSEECVNVKILLSDGLSFSKIKKETVKDLGQKCGSNTAGPVLNVPPPNNLVDKIYVNSDAKGGYENITIQFGDQIVDYNIYFLVLTDETDNDVISNKSRTVVVQSNPQYLDYYLYEPDYSYYVLYDGEVIPFEYLDYNFPNGCDAEHPCTPVDLCFDCDTNMVSELKINLEFLDVIELGDHTLTFISENGQATYAKVKFVNSSSVVSKNYIPKSTALEYPSVEPTYCINTDLKLTFTTENPNINDFSILKINNKPVLSSNYTVSVKNNNVEIVLKKEFVATLDMGVNYTVKAEFNNGTGNTSFSIDGICDVGDKIEILTGNYQLINNNSTKKILTFDVYLDIYTNKNYSIDYILIDGDDVSSFVTATTHIYNPVTGPGPLYAYYGSFTTYSIDLSRLNNISEGTHQVSFVNDDGNIKNAYFVVINSDNFTPKKYNSLAVGEHSYCNNNIIKFTIDDPGLYFSHILINDNPVLRSKYNVTKTGRTEISLNKEFVADLGPGNYTIKIIFADGDTSIDFSIKDVEECIEPVAYEVVSGSNQVFNINNSSKLSFKINADIDKFVNVYVNNKIVDSSNYNLTSGSTIVTFTEEYTKTLENGQYIIRAEFTDGEATTTFVINNAEVDNPNTGAFISSMILIPCLIVGVILYRNKKRLFNL